MPHPKWDTAVRFRGGKRYNTESEMFHLMTEILSNKKM